MSADLEPEDGRNRRERVERFLERLGLLCAIYKIVREIISSL
ncbi:hypothetical protein [Streptomyces sp. ODS28]